MLVVCAGGQGGQTSQDLAAPPDTQLLLSIVRRGAQQLARRGRCEDTQDEAAIRELEVARRRLTRLFAYMMSSTHVTHDAHRGPMRG